MKKKFILALSVAMFAVVGISLSNQANSLSDLQKENLEALTNDESINVGCFYQCFPNYMYNCTITVSSGPNQLFTVECPLFCKKGF